VKLNLGAADRRLEGFLSVDITPPADIVADLSQPWPWADSSVEEVIALDIFEHLPSRVQTMNELWRVLQPGGRARIEVPSAVKGAGFAQDPTHVSAWAMNSFQYYQDGSFATQRLGKSYGVIARFKIISLTEREVQDMYESVWKITAVLEAVK
jgi:ubiquinone/menaquinone biosynthesis C-methylase UbiE